MKVLVTGAERGMIGSALCDALLARGDSVIGLTRDEQRAAGSNPGVVWHTWQPSLERPPAEAFDGVDGVVNLLGEGLGQRWTDEDQTQDHGESPDRHAQPRRRQSPGFKAAHRAGQPVGGRDLRRPRCCDRRRVKRHQRGLRCRRRPRMGERRAEVEPSGVRLAILRTGHVLDPRGGLLGRMLTSAVQARSGRAHRQREVQYMPWIRVDDKVALIVWALDDEEAAQRRPQRDRAQPGHQPRALAGARPHASGPARRPSRSPASRWTRWLAGS